MAATSAVRFKVVFYLVLVPLLLSLYPTWQTYRAHRVAQDEVRIHAALDAVAGGGGVAAVQGRASQAQQQREGSVVRLTEALAVLQSEHASLRARTWLGTAGMLTALAGAGLGAGILWKIRHDSRAARRSLQTLLNRYETNWRQVSWLVMLHVLSLLATLSACVAYESFWAKSNWYTHGYLSILMTLPLWGAIYVAIKLMIQASRQLTAGEAITLSVLGRVQSRAQAPGLWSWIEGLAAKAGAPVPDHVVVGLADGFYVTSARVVTQPQHDVLEGRTLYVPLPYVSALSRDETAAIVGHELAHFAHRDTDRGMHLGMMRARMLTRIEQLIEQDEAHENWMTQPPLWAFIHFYESFDGAVMHWSRVQEFAADTVGARVAGADVCASALLRTTALADVFDAVDPAMHAGENHVGVLLARVQQQGLELAPDVLDHVITHPIDTHPPTRLRIDALNVPIDAAFLAHVQRRPDAHDTGWFTQLLSSRAA